MAFIGCHSLDSQQQIDESQECSLKKCSIHIFTFSLIHLQVFIEHLLRSSYFARCRIKY